MGADISTIEKILKDVYLPPIVEQLNNETLFLQRLEARDQEIAFGKQAIVPLHIGRSGGIGNRKEWERLADPGNQAYARAIYDIKYAYGAFGVSGPSQFRTRSEMGAFAQVLKGELDGLRNDLKKDLARQFWGNGLGQVAALGTTTASNDVTLGDAEAATKGQLYAGMVVDIGTASDPQAVAVARTVIDVDPAGPTFTISGAAVTTTSSHRVFRSGTTDTAGNTAEFSGMQQIVSTTPTEFGGIDPADIALWDNQRLDSSGSFSRDEMMQLYNKIRIAGGETSALVGSFGIQRIYFNSFGADQVRFNNPQVLKGGFTYLDFQGLPLIADIDAPWGKIYFLEEKYLKVYSNGDWAFLDEDGHILKWVTGYDAWQGVLARYMNIGVTRRNTQGVYYGITDPGF